LLKEKRPSNGPLSAPRVIVLVGLSSLANVGSLAKDLLAFAEGGDGKLKSSAVACPTYKLRTTVLQAPYGDLTTCIELAKVADLLAFVLPATLGPAERCSSFPTQVQQQRLPWPPEPRSR
jgi:pre-rRNA-processing protein TSR1